MEQTELTMRIDKALEQYRGRDLVSAAEVTDLLLDLRLMLRSSDDKVAEPAVG